MSTETKPNALLLIGSAKHPSSTSASLGVYLKERLAEHGIETSTLALHKIIHRADKFPVLLDAIEQATIIIFSFPLYVDTVPYQVTSAMEKIFAHYETRGKSDKLAVFIVNCGFPEASHNCTALNICYQFTIETGFTWAGGLSLGGGEAINGETLEKRGGLIRHVMQALDMTADALAAGQKIPDKAISLMTKPFIPTWMYTLLGNMHWKREAKKHGAVGSIRNCPYQRKQDSHD